MNWKHGYYADGGYTFGYYAETMPLWLQWSSLIQGHQTKSSKFRYLDAGCGQGLNLIIAAAAHPDSEFVGIDFMPEHVAHARMLAEQCGLKNVSIYEADFVELAKEPEVFGTFDYAVCHGISTWISPTVKSALFQFIGQSLNPAGVFYNSYNTYPGWLGATPFQHLVLMLQESRDGKSALHNATEIMQALQADPAPLHKTLPGLTARLQSLKGLDPDYLVQEYNNQYWQPVFVSQMISDLANAKLSYLGTATLSEAFSQNLPPNVQQLLKEQNDGRIVEQLRDYAINQSFRRDLYVKGRQRPWGVQERHLLGETKFLANPSVKLPNPDQPFQFACGSLTLNGDAKAYTELIDLVAGYNNGVSLHQLQEKLADSQIRGNLPMMLSMLLRGGWINLFQESNSNSGHAVNRAMAKAASEGAPYRFMSVPRLGGASGASDLDWLMYELTDQKVDPKNWPDALLISLNKLGRHLMKDGQPMTDPKEIKKLLKEYIDNFSKRLDFLKVSGAL